MRSSFFSIAFFLLFTLSAFFLLQEPVFAQLTGQVEQNINSQLNTTIGAEDGKAPPDPRAIAYTVISLLASLLGTIMTIMMIFAGYYYFTARGREEYIEKAKDTMRRAIIGMIIVFLGYSVTTFVFRAYEEASTRQQANVQY